MTIDEAKTVFLNRGYVEVEGGTIYDADKWRESCRVISEWLEQEPKTEKIIKMRDAIPEEQEYIKSISKPTGIEFDIDIDKKVESYEKMLKHPVIKSIMGMDETQESCDVPDTNIGKMSESPTGSKDVIWYSKRNYSEIVVEPQETKQPEISSYYGLKSYVRERSNKE